MCENNHSFGEHLATLRQAAGLSQQALADRLCVTRQAVSNWERGQTLPDLVMLRAIAQALGTDLNTLGSTAPAAKKPRQIRRSLWAAAALALVCALSLGAYVLRQPGEEPAPSVTQYVSSLSPHRVQFTTADGITITTASDGRQELPELLDAFSDAEPGPVKRTAELGDTLAYLAGQYMLSLAPEYQGGQLLSSWDETLFWLYKIGISRGNIMTREQVEAALSDLLGYTKAAAHQSTSHFTLTEEGYVPQDVASARPLPFSVKALEKGEGQDWEALLEQEDGTAVTLTLTLEEDTVRFSSISHTGGSL